MDSLKWSNNYFFYSSITIKCIKYPLKVILDVPFEIGRTDSENSQVILSDIKKVYHQNNCTNQVLHTVSQQVNMVSTQVEAIVKK